MTDADKLSPDADAIADLRRRLAGFNRLLDVARELAAEIDLEEILRIITREACQAMSCERASLYQYDAKRDELYSAVATELEIAEIRNSVQHGVTGHVARRRELANVSDPANDPRWNSSIDRATGFHTRNILAAPLTSPHDQRLLGVLQLLNKRGGAFDHFDEELIVPFTQHAAAALDRARLVDELRRRQEVEASLNVARDIQRGFMPGELPQVPNYQVATWWYPNQAVGGDYCDIVPLRDGRVGLVIADVSGHGLGPSLIMASVRAALRALVLEHTSPEVLLRLLAGSLADDLQDGRFITMVVAALDPIRHTLEFANAGHAPALHYSIQHDQFTTLAATGVPLGVLESPDYPPGPALAMETGDVLVLCTDGIVEAMDHFDEQFGQQRLEEIIREQRRGDVEQLVHAVGRSVEQHFVGEGPPDDLTILAVRRVS